MSWSCQVQLPWWNSSEVLPVESSTTGTLGILSICSRTTPPSVALKNAAVLLIIFNCMGAYAFGERCKSGWVWLKGLPRIVTAWHFLLRFVAVLSDLSPGREIAIRKRHQDAKSCRLPGKSTRSLATRRSASFLWTVSSSLHHTKSSTRKVIMKCVFAGLWCQEIDHDGIQNLLLSLHATCRH